MLDLGALRLSVNVDSDEAKQELGNLNQEAGKVSKSFAPIGAAAKTAAVGIAGLATAAVALVEGTREYRTEQAKLKTAFETTGKTAEMAKDIYSKLYAVTGDTGQSTEAAQSLTLLCDTQEELNQWTDICTGAYAKFGSTLPIEQLTEAANETAKTGEMSGGLSDALNRLGLDTAAFQVKLNSCSTEQERQKLITGTLSGELKAAGDAYKITAKDVMAANSANDKMTGSFALIAQTIEPAISAVKTFVAGALVKLSEWITSHQSDINGFIDSIKGFGNFLLDNKDIIIAALAGIGTGLLVFNVAGMIQGVVGAIKAFKLANEAATIAQALLNAVMALNPFVLIAAAVAALVAGIVIFISTNEEARTKIAAAWEAVKTAVKTAVDAIVGFFSGIPAALDTFKENFKIKAIELFNKIKDGFIETWNTIVGWFSGAITAITTTITNIGTNIKTAATGVFNKMKEAFSSVWNTITTWFSGVIGTITTTVSGIGTALYNAGVGIFTSLLNGLKSVWTTISTWVSEKIEWMKSALSFWRSSNDEMSGSSKKKGSSRDGSHRTGLREVPFDGYVAELHKGERILTAAEANRYQNNSAQLANILGTQLALSGQNKGSSEQTLNLIVEVGGTKFGEAVVKYGDEARKKLGTPRVVVR